MNVVSRRATIAKDGGRRSRDTSFPRDENSSQ